MIIKGVSDIRGIHGMNTRPGPLGEGKALLELYQLATEKEHLQKKLQRIRRQKDQAEKRLSDIGSIVRTVKQRTIRESAPHTTDFHHRFIQY